MKRRRRNAYTGTCKLLLHTRLGGEDDVGQGMGRSVLYVCLLPWNHKGKKSNYPPQLIYNGMLLYSVLLAKLLIVFRCGIA